jgi:hypothetical protein
MTHALFMRMNSFRTPVATKLFQANPFSNLSSEWKPIHLSYDQMRKLIAKVDKLNLEEKFLRSTFKFIVQGQNVGLITKSFATALSNHPDVFHVDASTLEIKLSPLVDAFSLAEKSDIIHQVNLQFKEQHIIKGWRDELLPVSPQYHTLPILLLERAAVPLYGTKAYGVHVNGYTRDPVTQQVCKLWVARRSKSKSTWPGMLDHIVAGGQPHGVTLQENVLKECHEEASIPSSLASHAKPVGIVSYIGLDETQQYIKRDTLFCYDLELPATFQPVPNDHEVEWFQLHNINWVLERLLSTGTQPEEQFKPNCNLVIIDFLVRLVFSLYVA